MTTLVEPSAGSRNANCLEPRFWSVGHIPWLAILRLQWAPCALLLAAPLSLHAQATDIGFALQPQFGTNDNYELPENAGQALVDVVILGDTNARPVSVEYRTEPGSNPVLRATPVEDYTPMSGTLTFATGETRKTVAIPITNDSRSEGWTSGGGSLGSERFRLLLENPKGGLLLSQPREVEIWIVDNDPGYFIVPFNAGPLVLVVLEEASGVVTVNVSRLGDYDFASSVHYRVATTNQWGEPGSATAGLDFLPTEGTLTFGANETNKTFTITLLDDSLIEGDEDFFILLDQATGGVPIQTPEVRAIIRDGERNPARVDPDFKPDWPAEGSTPLLVVQPTDGKILLVAPADRVNGEDGTLLLRLLPDGQPDPAWRVPAISGTVSFLVLQGNGQVLIAATQWREGGSPDFTVNGVPRRHLARFDTNGVLDAAFSAALPTNTFVTGLAAQSDRLILAAVQTNGIPDHDNVLFRLDETGSIDPAFKPPTVRQWQPQISPTPDGGIFVAEYGSQAMVRFNPNGSPDEQFRLPEDGYYFFQAVQPDGRLLVIRDSPFPQLARLTASGQLDSTFTLAPAPTGWGHGLLPTTTGKIWILDRLLYEGLSWVLRRINADGSPDPGWPVAQFQVDRIFPANKLLELPDGNLLLAQFEPMLVNGHLRVLARLLVNAPLPRFELDPASATVPESGGKLAIKLLRCGTSTEPVTVTWRTEGGTARPDVDYVSASGTLIYPAGESVATLELQVLDNAVPDEDRTVRLQLQGPPPESREYPLVEITIVNDDLGFLPNGIKRFANGRVLLRPARVFDPRSGSGSAYIEASETLRNWTRDFGGDDPRIWIGNPEPEFIDRTAPAHSARFYRLRKEWP